jgi:hypothetical protein
MVRTLADQSTVLHNAGRCLNRQVQATDSFPPEAAYLRGKEAHRWAFERQVVHRQRQSRPADFNLCAKDSRRVQISIVGVQRRM